MTREQAAELLRTVAAILAGLLVVLAAYGLLVEPRIVLDVRREQVPIPHLPTRLSGTTVAVVTDLQTGMWLANVGMVERAVARIVDEDPDLVLLGGDFVYSRSPDVAAQVAAVRSLLAPLVAGRTPVYAVLGNHDHAAGATDELTATLEGIGIEMLRNDAVVVPDQAAGEITGALHVVGVGPVLPGLSDPRRALDGLPDDAARIVLMHNPASYPHLPAHSAPLAVAGHTHCGQIAIPGLPAWSWLALRADERVVVDGFAPRGHGAAGNRLFVTCGIGFSLVPARINAPPQVAVFELLPAPGDRDAAMASGRFAAAVARGSTRTAVHLGRTGGRRRPAHARTVFTAGAASTASP